MRRRPDFLSVFFFGFSFGFLFSFGYGLGMADGVFAFSVHFHLHIYIYIFTSQVYKDKKKGIHGLTGARISTHKCQDSVIK